MSDTVISRAAPARAASPAPRERHVSVSDGLRLFVRDFVPEPRGTALPLVCLPGLTRDGRDFVALARHFVTRAHTRRRVVAIDFRGRGRSDHDSDPGNYAIGQELQDMLDVLAALEIPEAIMIGTSRGGLVTMQMAAVRPALIAGAVLNDIGPDIGVRGLLKIKNALERIRAPEDWDDAASLLEEAYASQFPRLGRADWADMARRTYVDRSGRPVPPYDPELLKALARIDFSQRLPGMWPQFDALARVPLLVLRGENSDLLPQETLDEMKRRHPALACKVVADAGHVPSLDAAAQLELIEKFCDDVDRGA